MEFFFLRFLTNVNKRLKISIKNVIRSQSNIKKDMNKKNLILGEGDNN